MVKSYFPLDTIYYYKESINVFISIDLIQNYVLFARRYAQKKKQKANNIQAEGIKYGLTMAYYVVP